MLMDEVNAEKRSLEHSRSEYLRDREMFLKECMDARNRLNTEAEELTRLRHTTEHEAGAAANKVGECISVCPMHHVSDA
jgi:ferredoxin